MFGEISGCAVTKMVTKLSLAGKLRLKPPCHVSASVGLGLSRALKMSHRTPMAGPRLAVTASACVPWSGTYPLRPLRLLRLASSAAGGARLCSIPDGAPAGAFPKMAIKKQPYAYRKAVCGAPSGTRTQDPLIKSQLLSLVARTHGALK